MEVNKIISVICLVVFIVTLIRLLKLVVKDRVPELMKRSFIVTIVYLLYASVNMWNYILIPTSAWIEKGFYILLILELNYRCQFLYNSRLRINLTDYKAEPTALTI